MKTIPLLIAVLSLCSCADRMPIKVSVCKDDVCIGIETEIPARIVVESGKEVVPVQ